MEYIIIGTSLLMLAGAWFLWRGTFNFFHRFNLAELIPDALLLIDREGHIHDANSNAEKLFGYSKKELSIMKVEELMPERFRRNHVHQRDSFHTQPKLRPMGMGRDLHILTKDGKEVPAEIALSPATMHAFTRNSSHLTVALLHDITERKRQESVIYDLAYKDQLTGLPNRESFHIDTQKIIDRAINAQYNLGFMMIDIRGLKKINDSLGHFIGDDVIQRTGIILNKHIDDYVCACIHDITLFKISGNEFLFIMVYDNINAGKCIDDFSSNVLNSFKTPSRLEGTPLDMHININIGISVLPIHGMSSSQLLKTADIALIKAKQMGMNIYCFYNDAMSTEFNNFVIYENAIRHFIKTKDFNISFQPVWNIKKEKYVGAEVLFRCNEKTHQGMDVEFLINVAESTGLIVPLGAAIFERACLESTTHNLICDGIVISVNASIQQIEDDEFSSKVKDTLKKYRIDPKSMAIEITETTLMNREARAIEKIRELREYGVRIYIDDFGKGFSSLAYLKQLPADKIKIDMSFLEGIETEDASIKILSGVIDLGHAIGLTVCTEGVETATQLNILKEIDCDEIQGYYKGIPTSGPELRDKYSDMYTT